MIGVFCDSNGNSPPGTDSTFYVDGRYSTSRRLDVARLQRSRFEKNFVHKYNAFTHVYFVQNLMNKPLRIFKL